jgi:hypothetical protein
VDWKKEILGIEYLFNIRVYEYILLFEKYSWVTIENVCIALVLTYYLGSRL